MTEPSVLAYARYFDLVQEYSHHSILRCLELVHVPQSEPSIVQTCDEQFAGLLDTFASAAKEYISLANDEPFQISQDVAAFLQSSTGHKKPDMTQVYHDLLPDHNRFENLKIHLPLLQIGTGDVRKDVRRIKKGVDLDLMLDDILESYEEVGSNSNFNTPQSTVTSTEVMQIVQRHSQRAVRSETLEVTADILKFLKKAIFVNIDAEKRFEIIASTLPKPRPSTPINFNIVEDDFDLGDDDDSNGSQNVVPGPQLENIATNQIRVKQEADHDLLYNLDAALNQEMNIFETETQQDKDMDDLFEQFISHDIGETSSGNFMDKSMSRSCLIDDERSRTAFKLAHPRSTHGGNADAFDETMNNANGIFTSQNFEKLKIDIPKVCDQRVDMPEIELSTLLDKQVSATEFNSQTSKQRVQLEQLPFPIPTMQDVMEDSKIADNSLLHKYLGATKRITMSDQLLWKEPGLRILDEGEDEIDLKIDDFCIDSSEINPIGLCSVAPAFENLEINIKRENCDEDQIPSQDAGFRSNISSKDTIKDIKQEPWEEVSVSSSRIADQNTFDFSHIKYDQLVDSRCDGKDDLIEESTVKGFKASRNSGGPRLMTETPKPLFTSDSLSGFLELKGKQFKHQVKVQNLKVEEIASDPIESTQKSITQGTPSSDHSVIVKKSEDPIISPQLTPLTKPRTITMNNSLLQHKPLLIQFLERRRSNMLSLIYRDLDIPESKGPDIILTPKICLIITSLQSLRQRPLPGKKSISCLSSVHDQIVGLHQGYESIFVLIHYLALPHQISTDNDFLEQTQFISFCHTLFKNAVTLCQKISPIWIPCTKASNTPEMVNSWVWRMVNEHAFLNASVEIGASALRPDSTLPMALIEDETLWELFLVRAGLNPMAAQVVIGSLGRTRNLDDVYADSQSQWGLRKLASMSAEGRHVMFDNKIGRHFVERLNKILCT